MPGQSILHCRCATWRAAAYAKANPGKLNYGSIGNGSWYHLATEKLLAGLGIDATHGGVPYKEAARHQRSPTSRQV
ncbi:MAG: hypothetical protein IPG24_04455 [Leptospiraceae bacterium]|nr:hypothetical protein [Leptospiraceae bacterium]